MTIRQNIAFGQVARGPSSGGNGWKNFFRVSAALGAAISAFWWATASGFGQNLGRAASTAVR